MGGTFHSAGQNRIIENAKTDLICLSQMQDEVGGEPVNQSDLFMLILPR